MEHVAAGNNETSAALQCYVSVQHYCGYILLFTATVIQEKHYKKLVYTSYIFIQM